MNKISSKKRYKTKVKIKITGPYICKICGIELKSASGIASHILNKHDGMLYQDYLLNYLNIDVNKINAEWNSKEEERKLLGNVWDKIDDVHGQLVQDNLFWNNMVKDVSNMFFRSFGWTYGTLKVAGTALKETALTPGRVKQGGEVITPAMGVLMGYPIAIGMVGAVMNYFNTGQAPKEMMDYFFPKSGQQTADGRDIRLSVPGYMKDMFSYAKNPVQTLLNKMSPELQAASEAIQNKDYYGTMIVNPDDPKATQAEQMGKFLLSNFEPFSIQSFLKVQATATTESKATSAKSMLESLGGFQIASTTSTETPLQQKISAVYDNQLGIKTNTPEQEQILLEKSAAKKAGLTGDYSALQKLRVSGVYTSKGYKQIVSSVRKQARLGLDTYQEMFSKLPYAQQEIIYNTMSSDDKTIYSKLMKRKPAQ